MAEGTQGAPLDTPKKAELRGERLYKAAYLGDEQTCAEVLDAHPEAISWRSPVDVSGPTVAASGSPLDAVRAGRGHGPAPGGPGQSRIIGRVLGRA
jgi:hypothetical protein